MSNPPRKRIVINLNQTPSNIPMGRMPPAYDAGTGTRRRWPKVLGFFAIALVLILALAAGGGFLWWRHYRTTPAYSLAVIVDAAQRNDMTTFDRLVDSDKIVSNLGSQVLEKMASPVGLIPGLTINRTLQTVPPSLLQPLKQGVRDHIAQELKKISGESAPKPFIVIALTLPTLVKITNEPNQPSRVAATVPGESTELTMQQDGETWKIVGLKDDALITKLINDFVSDNLNVPKEKAIEPGKTVRRRRNR
jgi:hypothetical protein